MVVGAIGHTLLGLRGLGLLLELRTADGVEVIVEVGVGVVELTTVLLLLLEPATEVAAVITVETSTTATTEAPTTETTISTVSTATTKVAVVVGTLERAAHGASDLGSLGALISLFESVLELLATEEWHWDENAFAGLLVDSEAEGSIILDSTLSDSDTAVGCRDLHRDVRGSGKDEGGTINVSNVHGKGLAIGTVRGGDVEGDSDARAESIDVTVNLGSVEEVAGGLCIVNVRADGDEAVAAVE